jgi:hypothetical protein
VIQLPSLLRVSAAVASLVLVSACTGETNSGRGTASTSASTPSIANDPGSRLSRGGPTGGASASGSATSGAYNPAVVSDPGSRASRGGPTGGASASGSATSGAYNPAVVSDPGSRASRGGPQP